MSNRIRVLLMAVIALCLFGGTAANANIFKMFAPAPVFILDPGHGGADPGAHGRFLGKDVYEAPYVYDTVLRVQKLLRARGAIVILTRYDSKVLAPINAPASTLLKFVGNHDCFTFDHHRVQARTVGMRERLAVAKAAMRQYRGHKIAFLSVHFDAESTSSLQGVSVITPSGVRPQIVTRLVEDFNEHARLRRKNGAQYSPLIVNGTARKLYILRADTNPVFEKALVELGNFGNRGDVYRIRDPQVRQAYAAIIAEALMRYSSLPPITNNRVP